MISCSSVKYDYILKGLAKNYTNQSNLNRNDYVKYGEVDKLTFKKDSICYIDAKKKFYNSDYKIINYLLGFKNDTLHHSSWVQTINPLMSKYEREFSDSKNALILIDNYLINSNHDTIIIPNYIDKISYEYFELNIYNKNSKKKTKEAYIKYIECIEK